MGYDIASSRVRVIFAWGPQAKPKFFIFFPKTFSPKAFQKATPSPTDNLFQRISKFLELHFFVCKPHRQRSERKVILRWESTWITKLFRRNDTMYVRPMFCSHWNCSYGTISCLFQCGLSFIITFVLTERKVLSRHLRIK